MYPYVLLIFVPLLFSFVSISKKDSTACATSPKRAISIGLTETIRNNNLVIPVFFILFFALLCFRDESIGVDVKQYRLLFEKLSTYQLNSVLAAEGDILYNLLCWSVCRITGSYRIFLIVVAAIVVFPIASLFSEDRQFSFLKLTLFMILPVFIMSFSGLRQAIAFSIGTIAYRFVREKRFLKFIITAILAVGFHHSAFVIFAFYPLYHMVFKIKHLWFVVPVIGVFLVYNEPIFLFLTNTVNKILGEEYRTSITQTGAYTMLALFLIFALFAFVFPDENKMDKETLGLRNFLIMSVLLQCFAPLQHTAMRINYYFIVFLPILIPKIIKHAKPRFRNISYAVDGIMSLFFLVYYLVNTYESCVTGDSALGTYPYIPFWE